MILLHNNIQAVVRIHCSNTKNSSEVKQVTKADRLIQEHTQRDGALFETIWSSDKRISSTEQWTTVQYWFNSQKDESNHR